MSSTYQIRGGKHSIYGIYLSGTSLKNNYSLKRSTSYKYTTQLRSSKQYVSSERNLMESRDSASIVRFDGKLKRSSTRTIVTIS